jgi:hypothetical protein
MAAQLSKGHTYNPGDVVDAADLNALVDAATALTGLITDVSHGVVTATTGDKVLVSRGGVLKQADVSTFPGGVTTLGVTLSAEIGAVFQITVATPGTTPNIHFDFDTQTRRTFLAAPVGAGAKPSFRAISPADLPVESVDIAAAAIDCTLGNVFTKTLPTGAGTFNMAINNLADGQTIRVGIINNAAGNKNVSWSVDLGLFMWRGGVTPTVTATASAKDIFTFTKIVNPASTITYGYADQNFKP